MSGWTSVSGVVAGPASRVDDGGVVVVLTGWSSIARRPSSPCRRGGHCTVRRGFRVGPTVSAVVRIGDAKLRGVLILAIRVADELDAVASLTWLEMIGWNPHV